MEEKRTSIRLTIRTSNELINIIKEEAKKRGISVNQLIISVLNQRIKSRRFCSRNL